MPFACHVLCQLLCVRFPVENHLTPERQSWSRHMCGLNGLLCRQYANLPRKRLVQSSNALLEPVGGVGMDRPSQLSCEMLAEAPRPTTPGLRPLSIPVRLFSGLCGLITFA